MGEAFDLFGSISDEEFTAGRSYVAATTVLIDAKPLGVLTEPKQIAAGLRKHFAPGREASHALQL